MAGAGTAFYRVLTDDEHHGPLPVLLLALTVVTGLVDAVSILSLGRVFVANMTGNVVFIGFALAGAPGFSLAASLSALAGFLVGAGAGGGLASRITSHRGRLLQACALGELVCVTVGLAIVAAGPAHLSAGEQAGAASVVAVALGAQNAVVRRLGVPDLTTTVLTLTLTGLVTDVRHGLGPAGERRLLSVLTMFGGAVVGALLVLDVGPAAGLGAAVGTLLIVVVATSLASRRPRPWQRSAG